MKKHIARFLLLSAVIFLASACAKDEFQSLKKGNSLVFKGRIESTDTRTVVLTDGTEGKVYWVDGDEVRINGIPYLATVDEEDPRSATFNKKDENDPDPEPYEGMYYATYSCTYDPEIEVGQLPPSQYYADNSPMSAPMFAQSESSDLFLSFKNINALLEITLKGTGTVRSIKLSSENVGMTGKYAVKDGQSAYIVDEDMKPVTLFCISGVPLTEEGVKFYVSIPSGKYEALKVLITDMAGKTWETTSKNTAEVESNKIYPLTFEPLFVGDGDFTGCGAKYTDDGGKTWKGAKTLTEALNAVEGKNKSRSIVEALENDVIGENDLPDLSGKKITVLGNGCTYDVSNRTLQFESDASTDVIFQDIVFDGGDVDNHKRLYYNRGTVTFGRGTEFKNLVFVQDKSTAVAGIVCNDGGIINLNSIYVHDSKSKNANEGGYVSGGFISNYKGTLNATDVTAENLTCVGTSDYVRGALFFNNNTSSCIINIVGGIFKNCNAPVGGAINSQFGTVNISDALFQDCKASSNGGAIFYNASGTIKNTTFKNCSSSAKGGAMRVNGASTKLIITDCTFTGCSANDGGAINTAGGVIDINGNSVISNCSAAQYGGALYMEAAATINVSGNAKIDGCESVKYGGGIYTLGPCTISENAEISNCNGTYGGGMFVGKNTTNISGNVNFYGNSATSNGCAVCSGGDGAVTTITSGKFSANSTKAVLANTNAGAKLTVTGGWFLQEGTGTYLSKSAGTLSIQGGYYGPTFTTSLVASGYAIKDNPRTSADDIAAYEAGYTKKVF